MATVPQVFASTQRLFELIETKLHLLQEMQSMAVEQSDLVAQHDMSGLMSVLSRKQALMESLQTVQQDLQFFRDEDPESRIWESPEKRKRCQAMVSQCDQLISQLIVQENRSLDSMNLKRDSVLSQLQQNVAASQLQHAYGSTNNCLDDNLGGLSLEG
jgi:uncharacterized protein YPO0396